MNELFITGLGNVSPQKTFDNSSFLDEPVAHGSNHLKCQDPNYKEYVPADMLRRMSRIIRFGVAAGKICLADAGCSLPDAIITGTGLGCIEDTEKFLSNLISSREEFLTPTSFIQSTHNTVSAQIALLLKCNNYNYTFVHRGLSFESALLDSSLQLDSGQAETVLLGGMDEMTANTFRILQRLGQIKQKTIEDFRLLDDVSRGSIAGEGSAFFLLSSGPGAKNYAKVSGLDIFYNPIPGELPGRLDQFLKKNGRTRGEIDLVLLGLNGDPGFDKPYHEVGDQLLPGASLGFYKHLCGEYFTSTGFGLWLAAKILYHQRIPEVVSIRKGNSPALRTILIHNHFRNTEHSFILVTAP